jgi:hypothetical protein
MTLPRPYISYSAASLWYQNKSAFRTKYYTPGVGGGLSSVQMDFGKELADMLKDDPENPVVAHIPKYEIRDVGFTVSISDVPVLMFPDSLSLIGTPKFYEYKSGVDPWTQKLVDNHMQLKLYSLGIKEQYGAVEDLCHLFWLPTVMTDVVDGLRINGKQYGVTIQVPRLTGEIISFPCVVTEMERFRARQWIVAAAHEISADYSNYLKNV